MDFVRLFPNLRFFLTAWASGVHGATAIEYGLIAAGVACAAFGMMLLTGDSLENIMNVGSDIFAGIVAEAGF